MEEDLPGRSNSVESMNGGIVRMTITGNLKEEKNNPANCVVRCCQIRVTEIEFAKDYLRANSAGASYIIGVAMNKVRHTLKTMPIEASPVAVSTGRLPLDLRICFHYVHSLKEYDDILRVLLIQQTKKKQRHNDVVLASASIDMTYVLQCGALNEDIILRSAPSGEASRQEKGNNTLTDIIATLHATVWSFPEEVETIDDAQEWEMQEVPLNLSDEEELYDSESNDSEEVAWNPPSHTSTQSSAVSNTPTKNTSLLSQRLWEQHELEAISKKGVANIKKSKLQKLSSLLKPKHTKDNSDSEGYDRDDDGMPYETPRGGGEYDLGTDSSSDSDSRELDNVITAPAGKLSPKSNELSPPASPPLSSRREHNVQSTDHKPLDPTVASPKVKAPTLGGSDMHPALINFGDTLPSRILLINGLKRRGRKLEDCIARENSTLRSRFCVIATKKSTDVSAVITAIFNKHQQRSDPIRLGIVGSDSYINDVLRPFIEQLAKKPRGWEPLQFYVLPIGKNNTDIACHLASQDPTYQTLFFSPEWQDLFAQHEPTWAFSEDECQEIESRISQYMEGITTPLKLPIGEALLTYPDSASKSVPFLKGVHIGGDRERDAEEPSADTQTTPHLQLDYWIPKKKGPNEDHHEIKSPFNFAAVARLPYVASLLRATPDYKPTSNTLGFFVMYKDKSKAGRMNVLTRHFANKSKKKDEKEGSRGGPLPGKKKEDKEVSLSAITKLVCSVTNDNSVFRVVIDGVEYPGIKFVSVLPQWATHVKNFPIQVFTTEGDASGTPTNATTTLLSQAASLSTSTPVPAAASSQPIPVPSSTPLMGTRATSGGSTGNSTAAASASSIAANNNNVSMGTSPQTMVVSPKLMTRGSLEL